MLTRFLLGFTEDGDPLPLDNADPDHTYLSDAEWQSKNTKEAFRSRKEANRDSYLWDTLVERQARMVERQGFAFSTYSSVKETERVVRCMALETRRRRRLLGRAWMDACLIEEPSLPANIRTVPPDDNNSLTYVFVTVKQPDDNSIELYRERRRTFLTCMVLASLIDFPESKAFIGLASELGQEPASYDLFYFNVAEDANPDTIWTDAKRYWDLKKQAFREPQLTMTDVRDIPERVETGDVNV